MASQSLYRKWRSQTFSEVVGQEAVIQTLRNALKSGTLAHAYLFTGPRGTGKTTTARLLAKTINCLNPHNGEPCNECQQCREITSGSSFNVIEIDAASNRGIDSIRELREKVMVPPTGGKYKVYILDEAHMLTVEAFNALLKTLEEPPPHAIFVMATTDVHKMLPTVLSRCQRYDFKRFTMRQLIGHLSRVAQQEQVQLEGGAAELIARAAAGGMRDALSLLDQAIAYAGNTISLTQVQTMLGVADPRAIQKIISAIATLDSPVGLHLIAELMESGADLRQLNSQVAEFWRAMMLARAGANIAEITDSTDEEINEIREAARLFRLDELIECARIFAQNELVQKSQGTPQLGLELAFLSCVELHRRAQGGESVLSTELPAPPLAPQARAAAPQPRPAAPPTTSIQSPMGGSISLPQPRPTPPQTQPEYNFTSAPSAVARESEMQRPEFVAAQPEPPEIAEGLSQPEVSAPFSQQDRADETPAGSQEITIAGPIMPQEITDGAPSEESSLSINDVREKWEYIKKRVKTRKNGARIAAFLNGYALVDVQQAHGVPIVVIQANYDVHYKALQAQEPQSAIEWALKVELGVECRLRTLAPGASIPGQAGGAGLPPLGSQSGNGRNGGGDMSSTLNTLMAGLQSASAHVERPPLTSRPPLQAMPPVQQAPAVPPRPEPVRQVAPIADLSPAAPVIPTTVTRSPVSQVVVAPLARMQAVRENIPESPSVDVLASSSASRLDVVKGKASSDPVVREVMRMFKAEVKDIHLK